MKFSPEWVWRTALVYNRLPLLIKVGRTGTLHAWEQEGVVPDLQTVAKGLGAGYQAVGALLVSEKVVEALGRGSKVFMHFQTYVRESSKITQHLDDFIPTIASVGS